MKRNSEHVCKIEGVAYHHVELDDIPSGFASVPVTVNVRGEYHAKMVAGSIGIQVTTSNEGKPLDSLQPFSGWFMYKMTEI
jgi:hypothetical protein